MKFPFSLLLSSHKLEGTKSAYSLCSLQNGRSIPFKGTIDTERYHVQNRPEGCILFSSVSRRVSESCKISMGKSNLPVPLYLFWTCACTKGVHQVTESSHCSSEKTQCESNNILQRYAIDGQYNRGIVDGQGHTDICATKPGFSFKCSKISTDSPTDFTVFRGKHRLSENDSLASPGKGKQNKGTIQSPSRETTVNSQGSDKSDKPIVIDSNSSLTSSYSIYRYLQRHHIKGLARKGRFEESMKLSPQAKAELNWWIPNLELTNGRSLVSIPAELIISSDASMTGWGVSCQNQFTGEPWSIIERKCHINVLELMVAKLAIMTFTVNKKIQSIHMRIDNMAALKYLVKMRGTHK